MEKCHIKLDLKLLFYGLARGYPEAIPQTTASNYKPVAMHIFFNCAFVVFF